MKNNQKKYLDKVVEILVSEITIDYDKEKISFPFNSIFFHGIDFYQFLSYSKLSLSSLYNSPTFSFFSNYCKDTYGLGEDEIKYVWTNYTNIIKDKIDNGG